MRTVTNGALEPVPMIPPRSESTMESKPAADEASRWRRS